MSTASAEDRIKGPGPGGDSPKVADKDSNMRAAYSAATKRLREAHRDEFNGYQKEEAKKLGIDWSPKPTSEQRALAEVQRLLREHPGIAEQVTPKDSDAPPVQPFGTGTTGL